VNLKHCCEAGFNKKLLAQAHNLIRGDTRHIKKRWLGTKSTSVMKGVSFTSGEVWDRRDSGTEWTLEYCATYSRC